MASGIGGLSALCSGNFSRIRIFFPSQGKEERNRFLFLWFYIDLGAHPVDYGSDGD